MGCACSKPATDETSRSPAKGAAPDRPKGSSDQPSQHGSAAAAPAASLVAPGTSAASAADTGAASQVPASDEAAPSVPAAAGEAKGVADAAPAAAANQQEKQPVQTSAAAPVAAPTAAASAAAAPVVKSSSKDSRRNGHVAEEASAGAADSKRRGSGQNDLLAPVPRMPNKSLEGEQVAAGWPSWLASVAGEAIKGWVPRRADSFEKLDKIGQGTYSNVYKARDLESGKLVALKKVRFDNLEPESVRFMAREIEVLRRLNHPNVIGLEGLVTSRMSCSLYLVFEYMEHDLAGLAACPGVTFTEAQVKCYMQQLMSGLEHCHTHGVLHRDIKGSNLLLDNSGTLKIADFGLATFYRPEQNVPLTSRVVTLWYRPPELLLGATHYGVAVDLWSAGCILAELLAGKPIMPGRTEVEQLHKIFKLCGSPSEDYWRKSKLPHATIFKPSQPYKRSLRDLFKDFPATALALLDTLLAFEPSDRGSATAALKHDFFTTEPLPCDPSSLPAYPPSKEYDAKLRDEEARRQRAAGARGAKPGAGGDRDKKLSAAAASTATQSQQQPPPSSASAAAKEQQPSQQQQPQKQTQQQQEQQAKSSKAAPQANAELTESIAAQKNQLKAAHLQSAASAGNITKSISEKYMGVEMGPGGILMGGGPGVGPGGAGGGGGSGLGPSHLGSQLQQGRGGESLEGPPPAPRPGGDRAAGMGRAGSVGAGRSVSSLSTSAHWVGGSVPLEPPPVSGAGARGAEAVGIAGDKGRGGGGGGALEDEGPPIKNREGMTSKSLRVGHHSPGAGKDDTPSMDLRPPIPA